MQVTSTYVVYPHMFYWFDVRVHNTYSKQNVKCEALAQCKASLGYAGAVLTYLLMYVYMS